MSRTRGGWNRTGQAKGRGLAECGSDGDAFILAPTPLGLQLTDQPPVNPPEDSLYLYLFFYLPLFTPLLDNARTLSADTCTPPPLTALTCNNDRLMDDGPYPPPRPPGTLFHRSCRHLVSCTLFLLSFRLTHTRSHTPSSFSTSSTRIRRYAAVHVHRQVKRCRIHRTGGGRTQMRPSSGTCSFRMAMGQ